ncbi:MAG: hypothetical protein ACYC63_09020 [Armatimonadota bacterium]
MDSQLTGLVKNRAFTLGSDLVGVANIERFANAPLEMSPAGIFPEAKSVVVCALHHPDGCIEIGGREHPQKMGPYSVQGLMNTHLDHMSYEMSRFLEDLGYDAIPIAASNIWRYRNYKNLNAVFAPDMSHIYAAVTAGLTELGYHGISMSPEFGPRNRFVSIITTAPLDPSPLLPGDTMCDNCMQCADHCLAGALTKELDGFDELKIEDKTYRKVHKNLWRCSWGEHFGVDLDLEKPEKVTEENIIQTIRDHGLRGGEMGSCLRHCLPAHLRLWDRDYTSAPRRKQAFVPNNDTLPRYVQEELTAAALAANVDFVMVHDEAGLQGLGFDYKDRLPDAISAVTMGSFIPESATAGEMAIAAHYFASLASFLGARKLENLGYSVVVSTDLSPEVFKPAVAGLAPEGWQSLTATFFTSAPLAASNPSQQSPSKPQPKNLTRALKAMAKQWDVDQIGVASPERLADLKRQLAPIMDGEKVLNAVNKGKMWLEFEPEVTEGERKLRDASDFLPDAKSVVVVGLRLPQATVDRVFQPPTEVVGPYVFAQYVVQWILREKALLLTKWLRGLGYKAEISLDLMNTGSVVANPRGPQQSVFSNRFEAVAAGLGAITKGGFVTTQDFGTNMRYLAVVTDAPFEADVLQQFDSFLSACDNCDKCMQACPPQAYSDEVTVNLEGQPITFHRLDQKRCDWCARYGLMGGDGFANMGVDKDIYPPDEITGEALADGLRTLDTVQGHHRCGVESCVVNCPLSK